MIPAASRRMRNLIKKASDIRAQRTIVTVRTEESIHPVFFEDHSRRTALYEKVGYRVDVCSAGTNGKL
jgi:hypothetical protein